MSGRQTITELDLRAMLDIVNSADRADELPIPGSVLTGLFDLIGCDTLNLTQFDARERIVCVDHFVGDSYAELAADEAEWERLFYRNYWGSPTLTARQRQLLRLVAGGDTNGQIARRLSISEPTVRKHLENIFERLGVTSRTAAVTEAFGVDPFA
jgi:DNA-binding CsgD family transcriptional regulator